MRDRAFDYEEFHKIPVSAKLVADEDVSKYLAKMEEARARMKTLGFGRLLDKHITRRPPKLRRKIT